MIVKTQKIGIYKECIIYEEYIGIYKECMVKFSKQVKEVAKSHIF